MLLPQLLEVLSLLPQLLELPSLVLHLPVPSLVDLLLPQLLELPSLVPHLPVGNKYSTQRRIYWYRQKTKLNLLPNLTS
jgi:hypothetical protein